MSTFKTAKIASDFKLAPYWWDDAAPESAMRDIPATADVVVVGSGYCGLHAAIELARNNLNVVLVDRDELGAGGSTRSGGMVSSGQKLVMTGATEGLSAKELSILLAESLASFNFLKDFILQNKLDADLQLNGRFFGAYAPSHFDRLLRQGKLLAEKTGVSVHNISRAQQRTVVGTDFYYGGILVDDYGGLHVGKYHKSLRDLAKHVGVTLCSHAGVEKLEPASGGMQRVTTTRGTVMAKQVIVATNGYSIAPLPFLPTRVIPVASYIIATETLPSELLQKLIPGRRMITDSQNNLCYMRPSPDNKRIIFGSRPVIFDSTIEHAAEKLYAQLTEVFPELKDYGISHAWKGFVGMTFDKRSHIETHDGVIYVAGCNGNGVALMSYLGNRVARDLMGLEATRSGFALSPFPTAWYYSGTPWFVPPATAFYEIGDVYTGLKN